MSTHAKTLVAVLGILLGIAWGEKSSYASEIAVAAFLLGLVQSVMYSIGVRKERGNIQMRGAGGTPHLYIPALVTLLFCFGLFFGILRTQFVEEKNYYTCVNICQYQAEVISSPESKNQYQIFNVHPNVGDEDIYDIQVRTVLYPRYQVGDILLLSGKVTLPKSIMPHTDTKNSKTSFDYTSYMLTKNLGSEMLYPKIEHLDSETNKFQNILVRWKEDLVRRIDMYVSSPESSLASGMLFGESSLSSSLLQTFRTAGLSHIIVLSGFNIVIVISSILFVLVFLPLTLRILCAIFTVIIFVMMVGASPSIIRAVMMAFITLLAMAFGRSYVARQALIISLCLIILYEPYSLLHDVSLHLSFLAAGGLIYLTSPLKIIFEKIYKTDRFQFLKELFITTCAAYIATLPYVIFTFGSVSVYSLIANVLVVPLVPASMLLTFLLVVTSYISETISLIVGYVDSTLISSMIWIAEKVESLPFSTVSLFFSFNAMLISYCLIFLVIRYLSVSCGHETVQTKNKQILEGVISY